MLLAPATGVAVIFEAKVVSDISAHVTFDLARNQLARSIDVMLEVNPALAAPLNLRKPERTFLVLLTPALTQPGRAGDAISKSRLYGWLMPAYKDPNSSLLRRTCPTATTPNWPKPPNDWAGRAGKTAASWPRVPARGLQPPRPAGDDATNPIPSIPWPLRGYESAWRSTFCIAEWICSQSAMGVDRALLRPRSDRSANLIDDKVFGSRA